MKTFLKLAAAFGLAACLTTSTAHAQGGGRGMGMMGGQSGVSLLANKSVQKELKLTEEQIEKAGKAATEQREKRQEKMAELRDLEQAERMEKMQAINKEFAAESKKITDELLKPEQAKRFAQISLQIQGFQAFNDADTQKALGMTDEQKNKVKDMQQEMMDKMRSMADEFQNDRNARRDEDQSHGPADRRSKESLERNDRRGIHLRARNAASSGWKLSREQPGRKA